MFAEICKLPGWLSQKGGILTVKNSLQKLPLGREENWKPLLEYRRSGLSEVTIHGAISWATSEKPLYSYGGDVLCYGRSLMKPVMIKPLVKVLENKINSEQKAIVVSSHNGTARHVSVARSVLAKSERLFMQTPPSVPLIPYGKLDRHPTKWTHCCSGEHAGILVACKCLGWNQSNYLSPDHPFFEKYLAQLRSYLNHEWSPLRIAEDGCGLPTVSNTVDELALVYANLAREKERDWIWQAMCKHPELVGGEGRLDTAILRSCKGKVMAKEGADGLLGMAIIHPSFPSGLGVVIKIAHGWNPQATWYLAHWILNSLGYELKNLPAPKGQEVFAVPQIVPEILLDQFTAANSIDGT